MLTNTHARETKIKQEEEPEKKKLNAKCDKLILYCYYVQSGKKILKAKKEETERERKQKKILKKIFILRTINENKKKIHKKKLCAKNA